MKKGKNIVYLYSEVMPYAIGVMRALVKDYGMQVDCVYWDDRKRTPFIPGNEPGITFYKRSGFDDITLRKFIEERNPVIIYVVGRMDELYLKTALYFRHKSHIVTGSDNQWTGSIKQKIALILSGLLYRRYFEYFWVPGKRQRTFAKKMGYPDTKIIENLLTADNDVFGNVYEQNKAAKKEKYPHNIVFAGRFAESKGVDLLVDAFKAAKATVANDWQLTLIGDGDIVVGGGDSVTVKGFMSGEELAEDCANWGVFCLPSRYEPWGVVVHEFTIAGLPMICSDAVGATDGLLVEGQNGYIFRSGDTEALKKTLLAVMAKTDEELLLMGARSHELSKVHSPAIAAGSLMSILK